MQTHTNSDLYPTFAFVSLHSTGKRNTMSKGKLNEYVLRKLTLAWTQRTTTGFQRDMNLVPQKGEGNISFARLTGQRSRNYELRVAWWVWWGQWRAGSDKGSPCSYKQGHTQSVMDMKMPERRWYLVNPWSYIFIYCLDGKKETGKRKEQTEGLRSKCFPRGLLGRLEGGHRQSY